MLAEVGTGGLSAPHSANPLDLRWPPRGYLGPKEARGVVV